MDYTEKKFKACGLTLGRRVLRGRSLYTYFLGVPLARVNVVEALSNYVAHKVKKPMTLIFDHALGGGAQEYIVEKIQILRHMEPVLRIQGSGASFRVSLLFGKDAVSVKFSSAETLYVFLQSLDIAKIYLNSLSGYAAVLEMLRIIALLKTAKVSVHMLFHDYACICPTGNLINYNDAYCALPQPDACEFCLYQQKIFYDMQVWREQWEKFLYTVADTVETFSEDSKAILLKAYPALARSVSVTPHKVAYMRPVKPPCGETIVIGILGAINTVPKGMKIVEQLAACTAGRNNIQIVVLGECAFAKKSHGFTTVGRYKKAELPEIIEKYAIKILFIPSIWPETFSYTTSEAIETRLPVACFAIGAQAAKVKNYAHGLVIKPIDAGVALDAMCAFLEQHT